MYVTEVCKLHLDLTKQLQDVFIQKIVSVPFAVIPFLAIVPGWFKWEEQGPDLT